MNGWLKKFPWREAALPCFATLCVLALLFRLSNGLTDLLLSVNLALSATIFLSVFFVRKPLEFSSFPTVLLTTTLFRLVLNVSTTRLILTNGEAGQVIDAFSRFVAGDNIVVGAVIFLIFIIIQFVVITKGSTRISEVSARFTLDALPGRQAAIDFDLNAGNIDESEARAARAELSEQADFFGAMDGASKFVRGDAIAGLAIVAINVVGGLCIGMAQHGLSFVEAAERYSKLTIGDGLVSQIPAFLISLATGLLVARSSRSQNVSEVALKQTFGKPIVLSCVGTFLIVLSLTGLPFLPLLTLATGCFALAWATSRQSAQESTSAEVSVDSSSKSSEKNVKKNKKGDPDDVERFLTIDPLELSVGAGLIPIAEPEEGPTLLERVRTVRQKIASELGLILPNVLVRDDPNLDDYQFTIKINGDVVSTTVVYPEMTLAVDAGFVVGPLKGFQTTAPGGRVAFWIDDAVREQAEDYGYELWTPGKTLEMKTLEIVRREASALLTRDGTRRLIERLRDSAPTLVKEALGTDESFDREVAARLAKIQNVLQLLLREGVSIRRLDVILEALSDLDLRELGADSYRALEFVRARMARLLTSQYSDEDGSLRALTIDPVLEYKLKNCVEKSENGASNLVLSPLNARRLRDAFREPITYLREAGAKPVVLVDRSVRLALRELMHSDFSDLAFLAFDELDSNARIEQEGVIAVELSD